MKTRLNEPTPGMARPSTELRRSGDLSVIRCAIDPTVATGTIGLKEVVELCKVRSGSRGDGRNWHGVRSLLLTIVCEWDLNIRSLDEQSDECLACLADFVAMPREACPGRAA